jgi:carboxypeptidase Taq
MNAAYGELRERLGEIHDLHKARAMLSWDQQVKMPPGGGAVRAEQLATLDRVAHEAFIGPEIGRLLDELAPFEESQPFDSDEASLVRVARRDWEKARRVPPDLRAEMSRAASLALPVWVEARQTSDYSLFRPHLETNLELRRRYIDCFDGYDEPYDVLLDDFERGMTSAEVRVVFDRLKEEQIPLVAAASRNGDRPARDRRFPPEQQQRFELVVLERFGFDRSSWRLDPTVHPFASSIGIDDIRLTTRYHETNLDGLFASMHECGHGLYEHGVSRELERTPLARGTSLGMHESQSRLWENLVGRSRPFWSFFYPKLQEHFPEALSDVDLDEWFASVNWVQPSFIRVEADEATYNLHVILRFELEQELIGGEVGLDELPGVWNDRMQRYLGVEPPEDRVGVLQDMHWAAGHIGYFSTYALGNIISAQIWERVTEELPDVYEQFGEGEFGPLREWLQEHLYRHGRKFTPKETLERLVGGGLDAEPYLRYLSGKLASLPR